MTTAVHGSKQINAPDRKLETLPVSLSKRDLEEWSNGSYMRHKMYVDLGFDSPIFHELNQRVIEPC